MHRLPFSPPALALLVLAFAVGTIMPSACTTTKAAPADPAAVTSAVKARLRAEDVSGLADLGVRTDADGTVWLSGRTYTQAAADRAMQIARTTPGATRVRSNIQALPETPR